MAWVEPIARSLPNGERLLLRCTAADDAPVVLQFRKGVLAMSEFVLTAPCDVRDDEPAQRISIERMLHQPRSLQLLALIDDRVVGMCGVMGSERVKLRHTVELGMTIAPPHWRKGIGRIMIEELLAWATAHREIERVTLDVMARNERARQMYLRAGFVEIGRDEGAYRQPDGRYETGLKMVRWVKPRPKGLE